MARKGEGPKVFRGDGLGNWIDASEGLGFGRGFSCGIGTRFADLDGDGLTDLVVADHCRGVRVYRGNGGTSWSDASLGIPTNVEGFNDVAVGDLDRDGVLDLVAVSAFSRGFLVLQGRPDGRFRVVQGTGLPEVGSGYEMELVDASGDGLLDVVASFNPVTSERREEPPPPAKVWIQDPPGSFKPASGFPPEGRFFGIASGARADRPGRDLFFALSGASAGLYFFEPIGAGEWSAQGRLDEAWFGEKNRGFIGLDAADLDLDGCLDLLVTGGNPPVVWLVLGDCAGDWQLCPVETLPIGDMRAGGWGVTAGDLNADGRLDVVAAFGTASRGGLKAWLQTD